jgi:hypothetical protein
MSISPEQKKRIDDWIRQAGRNQYGDPADAVYPGGNPLFNLLTGQQRDRYEYILSRHPELRINTK